MSCSCNDEARRMAVNGGESLDIGVTMMVYIQAKDPPKLTSWEHINSNQLAWSEVVNSFV